MLAPGLRLTADSAAWTDEEGISRSLPTSQISEVVIVPKGRGAREGLLVGSLIGFGTLYLYGYHALSGGEGGPGAAGFSAGIILGIPLGTIVGTVIGSTRGSTDRYVLWRSR